MTDDDLTDVLHGFTSYVMNERVRCYNDGIDAERERCAAIALEQRCEHDTAWDRACVAIAAAIRKQSEES